MGESLFRYLVLLCRRSALIYLLLTGHIHFLVWRMHQIRFHKAHVIGRDIAISMEGYCIWACRLLAHPYHRK